MAIELLKTGERGKAPVLNRPHEQTLEQSGYQPDGSDFAGFAKPSDVAAVVAQAESLNAAMDARAVSMETSIATLQVAQGAGVVGYATKAALDADLSHPATTVAYVTNDPTPANNGTYRKSGASGTGSWTQSSFDRVAIVEGRFSTVPATANLYDPSLAVDKFILNDSTGQPVSSANGAWTGLIRVDPGTRYVIWLSAETGSMYARLHFYSSSGLSGWLGTDALTGVNRVRTDSDRTISFTTPETAAYVGVTIYLGVAHTTAEFNTRRNAIMLEKGSRRTSFVAYSPRTALVGTNDSPALIDLQDRVSSLDRSRLRVTVANGLYYVRSKLDETRDLSTLWGRTGSNNVVNPQSASIIAATTTDGRHDDEHLLNVFHTNSDAAAPLYLNGNNIGGNHGHAQTRAITAASHGKTTPDIGSVWTDGGGVRWVLLSIPNANTLWMAREYTRNSDGTYTVNTGLTGTTLTHASGATNTSNITVGSSTTTQFYPAIRNHTVSVKLDGVTELSGMTYDSLPGDVLLIEEAYEILDFASIIDFAKASVGGGVAPDYTSVGVSTLAKVQITYEIRSALEVSIRQSTTLAQPARVGWCVATQATPLNVTGSQVRKLFVPDSLELGGIDYELGADITVAPAASVSWLPVSWRYASAPPSTLVQIVEDGGVPVIGLAFILDETVGVGRPVQRAASLATGQAALLNTNAKMYLIAFGDSVANTTVPAGTRFVTRTTRRYFIPSRFGGGY